MEIIVILAILILLIGLAVPHQEPGKKAPEVETILELVNTLTRAATQHHADTGRCAREYSGANFQGREFHQLSCPQGYPGWNGPYIDHPLSFHDNPFGSYVNLYKCLDEGGTNKPRVQGNSSAGRQYIAFGSIPEEVARNVDEILDRDMEPGDWKTSGRVRYVESAQRLNVLVFVGTP